MRLTVGSNVGAVATELSSPVGRQAAPLRSKARLGTLRALAPVFKILASTRPNPELPVASPRLLLIRPDHMGDVLLAAPAGLALRAGLPRARIDWLVGPWAADIIDRAPHADAVMTCAFPGFTRRPKGSPWEPYAELWRMAAQLQRRCYDLALVLRPDHWWGAMLAAAAGIPVRFGYAVPECRPFLTAALRTDDQLHSTDSALQLARLAASQLSGTTELPSAEPTFVITEQERDWAIKTLSQRGCLGSSPLVAMHPGSGSPLKNWLPERWTEVAAAIHGQAGARLILTGGSTEADLLRDMAAGLQPPPCAVLAGGLSLGQLAALFERCSLVLGVDSGPLHLAAAVGTSTVRVYGPTDAAVFGPLGDARRQRVVQDNLPCQPCGNIVDPPCGAVATPACLRLVSSERVVTEALRVMSHELGAMKAR